MNDYCGSKKANTLLLKLCVDLLEGRFDARDRKYLAEKLRDAARSMEAQTEP